MTDPIPTPEFDDGMSAGATVLDFPDSATPDAPYGVRADGTPRGKPGPKGPRRDAPAPAARRGPKKTSTTPPPGAPRKPPTAPAGTSNAHRAIASYTAVLTQAGAVVVSTLAATGRAAWAKASAEPAQRRAMVTLASAATLNLYAEGLAIGTAQLAAANPAGRLAKLLDKATAALPGATLTGAALGLMTQLAVNFGFLPAGLMGTLNPDDLANDLLAEMGALGGEPA